MSNEINKAFTETALALIKTLSSFSHAQFNKVPFEGSWTAGQVADHVYKSCDAILKSLSSPAAKTDRDIEERLPELKATMLDFETKLKSPSFILPSQHVLDKQAILKQLEVVIAQLQKVSTSIDLSELVSHPVLEEITKLEMFHFMVYHTQRHVHQLKNIASALINQHSVQPVQ